MATVERKATIAGSPDAVWAVRSDFSAISSWANNVDPSCLMSAQNAGPMVAREMMQLLVTTPATPSGESVDAALGQAGSR